MNLIHRLILSIALCLAACASPSLASASSPGGALSSLSTGAVAAASKRRPTATCDTSMGTAVDQNCQTTLPLRAGAHRFYVNSSTGSDSNNCATAENPATPKATIASATNNCPLDGRGDQVAVAENTSYAAWGVDLRGFGDGFSPQYPFVIQSYDPTDPTNEAKMGRATGTRRPVVTEVGTKYLIFGSAPMHYVALRGFDFNPGNVASQELDSFAPASGASSYVLIENNLFRYTTFSWDHSASGWMNPAHKFIFRNNAIYGQWSATAGVGQQGLYIANVEGITVEDNIFWHNGWKVGLLDTDPASSGGHNMFNHAVYAQSNAMTMIARRNAFVATSADSGQFKGGVVFQGNLSLRNPIGLASGSGNKYSVDKPFGSYIDISGNFVLSSNTLNGAGATGWGASSNDGKAGGLAAVRYNVLARNNQTLSTSNAFISANGADPDYGYLINDNTNFDHNVVYSWTTSGQGLLFYGGTLATTTNNIWDDPSSGSNVNNASAVFGNPYTETSLLAALRYPDEATAVADWITNPEQHGWERAPLLGLTNYGVVVPQVDLKTDMRITAGVANRGLFINSKDGYTLTPSGFPSCVTIDGPGRAWYADTSCTASSGTGSIIESNGAQSHTSSISWAIYAAPVLSSLSVTPGSTTASVNVSTNVGSGKLYIEADPLTYARVWPEIRAGYHINPSPPPYAVADAASANQAVTATGAQSPLTLSGLTASHAYRLQAVQVDANNNPSAVSFVDFTTTSGVLTQWTTANPAWAISGTNNNIATYSHTGNWEVVKANTAKSSGNWSATITAGQIDFIGFGNASEGINSPYPPIDTNIAVYNTNNGQVIIAGTVVDTIATATVGDTLTFTNTGGTITIAKNGTPIGSSYNATSVGTSLYPLAIDSVGSSATLTADFTNF